MRTLRGSFRAWIEPGKLGLEIAQRARALPELCNIIGASRVNRLTLNDRKLCVRPKKVDEAYYHVRSGVPPSSDTIEAVAYADSSVIRCRSDPYWKTTDRQMMTAAMNRAPASMRKIV